MTKLSLIFIGIIDKVDESSQHSKSKIIEKFLAGFDPEDSNWLKFLAEVFFDVFCSYNYQFITLLKNPIDAWSKAMWKLASDAITRIFNGLSNIDHQGVTACTVVIFRGLVLMLKEWPNPSLERNRDGKFPI